MVERREKVSTEGRGLGFSFAADNVDRGDPVLNQFIKRKPTYPIGDNPRGREIDWIDQNTRTFRSYRGLVPIEGQDPLAPKRVLRVGSIKELRPELPPRNVDTTALAAAQEAERALLLDSDYGALFPVAEFQTPSPGATFSPGSQIEIRVRATDIRAIYSATLFVDSTPVDRRVIDRRDQDSTREHIFIFLYNVPANRGIGPMDLTVRVFDIETGAQGVILDDAINADVNFRGGVGSQDGRIGRAGSTPKTNPQLEIDPQQFLRTPEGVANITVNIV